MGSFFQRTLSFIQAVAGRKLHLQFLRAIPLFMFTHDSCVMSTICQKMAVYAALINCFIVSREPSPRPMVGLIAARREGAGRQRGGG
jgi:hypothetical protein